MSISLAQAIRNAIAAEQSAEAFYLRLAQNCADKKGRALLTDIAAQERAHAATLEDLAAKLVAGHLPERADALVHTIETVPLGEDGENRALAESLELAMDAENSAVLYYEALAATSTGDASAFFERMGKEEEGHAAAIRALLDKVESR